MTKDFATAMALAAAALAPGGNVMAETDQAGQGRRLLTAAFVRMGPEGRLTADLRDGRTVLLHGVTMHPAKFCGIRTDGANAGTRFCARYGEVVGARAVGRPGAPAVSAAANSLKRP